METTRNRGIEESRNPGIDDSSIRGIERSRNPGTQASRNGGFQETRNPGIQESRNRLIGEPTNPGIGEPRNRGIDEPSRRGIQESSNRGIFPLILLIRGVACVVPKLAPFGLLKPAPLLRKPESVPRSPILILFRHLSAVSPRHYSVRTYPWEYPGLLDPEDICPRSSFRIPCPMC